MLRNTVLSVLLGGISRSLFVLGADVEISSEVRDSGGAQEQLGQRNSRLDEKQDAFSKDAQQSVGLAKTAHASDIATDHDSVAVLKQQLQRLQRTLVRRERKSLTLMADGDGDAAVDGRLEVTADGRSLKQPVETGLINRVAAGAGQAALQRSASTADSATSLLDTAAATEIVAGQPATVKEWESPQKEILKDGTEVKAKLETCVCLSAWRDTTSGPACAVTQYGCPSVICDQDVLPWCIVTNPGCLTEEFSEGGGWAYCNPKENDPFKEEFGLHNQKMKALQTGSASLVKNDNPDRLLLLCLMVLPVLLLGILGIFCGSQAVKSQLAKLSDGETNTT
jgi:ketosteroid isomerase-like protein